MNIKTYSHEMSKEAAVKFMEELVTFFDEQEVTSDMGHWSKTYNALNCRKIVELLKS